MQGGFTILPNWLISLFPSLKPRRRQIPDPYDYDLPPPRLRPNRLPITRPSTPQLQYHLLKFLPLEIRRQIWYYVLKDHTIHIDFDIWGTRLGCVHCVGPDPSKCNNGHCATRVKSSEVPPQLLSLLKTCRQM